MIQQPCLSFRIPFSPDVVKYEFDTWNNECPFYYWVGNGSAIRRLSRTLFAALNRPTHESCDASFAFLGPASTGKTTLARAYAKILGLPFVEIQPKSVTKVLDVVTKVAEAVIPFGFELLDQQTEQNRIAEYTKKRVGSDNSCSQTSRLQESCLHILQGEKDCDILLPPCVIFIDEVHALKDNIVQGLLNALESNDRMMQTEPVGKDGQSWTVDCSKVCWMVATTERGQLFGPFDSRFTKIQLDYYTREEMAEIVHLNNKDFSDEVCHLVAKFAGYIPREALDFAKEMRAEKNLSDDKTWEEAALQVADDRGVDETGMSRKSLKILTALGQGAVSKGRLATEARCGQEELEKYVLPMLMSDLTGDPAFVTICSKGCCLTEAGLAYLNKRGIPNKGAEAISKNGS